MKILILFLFPVFATSAQTFKKSNSPNKKFVLTVEMQDAGQQQTRYITTLTDLSTKGKTELVNCIRRDLATPNFYWDAASHYLIVEQCSDGFSGSHVLVFNLDTKKIDISLPGLIGNTDLTQQQFDAAHNILLYFDTSTTHKAGEIPGLCAYDIKAKKKTKLYDFETITMDIEFPEIKRIDGARQIEVRYSDFNLGKSFIKQLNY